MKITERSDQFLRLRRLPMARVGAALACLALGAVLAGRGWLEPSLSCDRSMCTLRTNLIDGANTFPRDALLGVEAEASELRPALGRLVVIVRDERIVFDPRAQNLRELQRVADAASAQIAKRAPAIVLGEPPHSANALTLFAVFGCVAFLLLLNASYMSLVFDRGRHQLTLRQGGMLLTQPRTLSFDEIESLQVREERDGRALATVMELQLRSGERIELDRYIVAGRADRIELKAAIEAMLRH